MHNFWKILELKKLVTIHVFIAQTSYDGKKYKQTNILNPAI